MICNFKMSVHIRYNMGRRPGPNYGDIVDSYYSDNTGGMSLNVRQSYSAVPEPSIILLLGIGLAGLLGLREKF